MDATQTTIDGIDLVSGTASLQWYEALAVVLELADTMERTATTVVPNLAHIRISAAGSVEVLAGTVSGGPSVAQLATMLKLLLQNAPAPAQLADVTTQAVEGSLSHRTFGHFVDSLHYFERPDRQMVLRVMVERVAASVAEARMTEELERLRAKAREAAMATPPAHKGDDSVRRRPRKKTAIAVSAVLVLSMVGASIAWWHYRPLTADGRTGVSSIVNRAGRGIKEAFNKSVAQLLGDSAKKSTPDSTASTVPPKPASRPTSGTRMRVHTVTSARNAASQAAPGGADGQMPRSTDTGSSYPTVTGSSYPALAQPQFKSAAAEPDPERGRIYSRLDADVTPPVPIQPSIGHVVTDAVALSGEMEVLVDETGKVERVTLLLPNRYQDRWLIYAVKARLFKPAVSRGQPVRYKLRMRTGPQ